MTEDPQQIVNVVDLGDGAAWVYHRYGPLDGDGLDDPSIAELVELPGPNIDTVHPGLLPPVAVQLAAMRQHALEQAGLADDDDEQRQVDLRLLDWFRRERERVASDGGALQE